MSSGNAGLSDHKFQGRKKKLSGWVKKIIQPAKEGGPPAAMGPNVDSNDTSPGKSRTGSLQGYSPSQAQSNKRIGSPRDSSFQYKMRKNDKSYMRSWEWDPEDPDEEEDDQDQMQDSRDNSAEADSNSQVSIKAIRELSPAKTDSLSMKVLWGEEPRRMRPETDSDLVVPSRDDESEDTDNVSIQALFSMCSSSFKSSTFSDMHSLQSTRATMISGRTTETNSSTVAIPPASILDRTRYGGSTANSTTTTNVGSPTPSLHHNTHSHQHQHHHHHHHPHSRHISRTNNIRQTTFQRERENGGTTPTATMK